MRVMLDFVAYRDEVRRQHRYFDLLQSTVCVTDIPDVIHRKGAEYLYRFIKYLKTPSMKLNNTWSCITMEIILKLTYNVNTLVKRFTSLQNSEFAG